MPKPYYADYATHAFRFYVRYPRANVSDCAQPADRENWRVCDEIYSASSVCDQKIIDIVFCYNLPLKSAVSYAAARTAKSESYVWRRICVLQQQFAKKRGLK